MTPAILTLVVILLCCLAATWFGTRRGKLGIFFICIGLGFIGLLASSFLLRLTAPGNAEMDGFQIFWVFFCIPVYWIVGYVAHASSRKNDAS